MAWMVSHKKTRSHSIALVGDLNEGSDKHVHIEQLSDSTIVQNSAHADTTIPTASLHLDATIRISRSDPDATIRKSQYLPSRIYLRAAELSRENTQVAPSAIEILRPNEQPTQDLQHTLDARPGIHPKKQRSKTHILSATSVVCLLLIFFLVAYETFSRVRDPRLLALPNQNKAQVDLLIAHARAIGVPSSFFAPVVQKEHNIDQSLPWFSPSFYASPSDAYQLQANQYAKLRKQLQQVMTTATQQLQNQAQKDLQEFQDVLSRRNMQPIGNSQAFTQNFSEDQLLMGSAHNPKDYLLISQDAHASINALNSMESMSRTLTSINTMLIAMKQAHLDVRALQQSYQQDMDTFNHATAPATLQHLNAQLQKQYRQIMTQAIQSFPAVRVAKLQEFTDQINTLKTYGKDVSTYLKLLQTDQNNAAHAQSYKDKLHLLQQIDNNIASMQSDLVQGQAQYLVKQFHNEVTTWGNANLYHDSFDGNSYLIDTGYMKQGIGSFLDGDLAGATTQEDFQSIVTEAQNALFNLHMMEADYKDKTPSNQMHATDTQLLDHYNLHNKQVLLVSIAEQAMRIYQNGALQQSYQVVTGRRQLPSLPGVWQVLDRKSPTIFISKDPKGSPYWGPDTPINYAILYHYGGYFVHDAFWRTTFGAGAQFPHQDAGGNTPYNFDGSHGCVNLPEKDMAWVYSHTDWNTIIVVY